MNNTELDLDQICSQAKTRKLDSVVGTDHHQSGSLEEKSCIPETSPGLHFPCIKNNTSNFYCLHVQNSCQQQRASIVEAAESSAGVEELLLTNNNSNTSKEQQQQLKRQHVDSCDVIKSTLNCSSPREKTIIDNQRNTNTTTHVLPVFVAKEQSASPTDQAASLAYNLIEKTVDNTKVGSSAAASVHDRDAKSMNILAFCNLLGKLKHLPRTGWLRHQIDHPEPVAGHMYRMAVLAFCLDDHQTSNSGEHKNGSIDKNRCIKLALVHDMAESIVGDITPHCGVSADEKFRRENEAMQKIATLLPEKVGREMYDLWREYESQSSPEAALVKQLDKFDLISQAYEYELETKKPKSLQEFFDSTSSSIRSEPILSWAKLLLEEREKCTNSHSETNETNKEHSASNIQRKGDNKD